MKTIRARVALSTFVVLAAVLAVAAIVIDEGVEQVARNTLDDHLRADAATIAALTHFDGKKVELDVEDETIASFSGRDAWFQVTSEQGLVERSASLEEGALPL